MLSPCRMSVKCSCKYAFACTKDRSLFSNNKIKEFVKSVGKILHRRHNARKDITMFQIMTQGMHDLVKFIKQEINIQFGNMCQSNAMKEK